MSGHPRRGRPGPFHRRLLPIVAVLCVVMTTGACNPLDVLHYLAGCKDGSSSSSSSSSSTVASTAKGEWTKLIGKTEGETFEVEAPVGTLRFEILSISR